MGRMIAAAMYVSRSLFLSAEHGWLAWYYSSSVVGKWQGGMANVHGVFEFPCSLPYPSILWRVIVRNKNKKQSKIGRPTAQGATLIEIYIERFKQLLGKILNYFQIPGFVRPTKIYDNLTKARLEVKLSGFFTIISVDGKDYYFRRLSGKFDGSGMNYCCDIAPPPQM